MTDNQNLQDIDPTETQEWLDALRAVLDNDGPERVQYLIDQLINATTHEGIALPACINSDYVNTIKPEQEKAIPPDNGVAARIQALIRWNAVAMVLRAGKRAPDVGGHIASYASAATLYEIAFNHFFRGPGKEHLGDLIYFQGHASPGIYARAFLEGRIDEEALENFRQEVFGKGLSSYPHPWLMPDFWQFPTVSMGLGPIQAIYQARFLKYLENRGLQKQGDRKVFAYLGDGETDEPESLGALSLASREHLDNLVFVINCNLQRLDGPVRGNGKIIQELEAVFRGAGWHVIKVIWGKRWDALLARDKNGLLVKRMNECVDGDYQAYKANDGAYVREHFFGAYPELKAMVEHMSDEEIWRLNRGGHDAQKVFAAYSEAMKHKGKPVVILAKTIKGYGMGAAGEGQNITHQQKKMGVEDLKAFRDRFNIPIPDSEIDKVPFYRPADDSPEIQYLRKQREALGGPVPVRRPKSSDTLKVPALETFEPILKGSGDREISTTMAFVRMLNLLLRDKEFGKHIVPIVPDECRTFGMEGMFRQYGIYSSVGQLYKPVDSEQVMWYREAVDGQILEEGITEAGGMCSWIAASTSYSSNDLPMLPFFVFYSMFGMQRVGDLVWAAGDMQARGFLIGGTAGRTTLAGEGLQHQDGHSHLFSAQVPNCISYDPTFGYELAVIVHDGMKRMFEHQENVFYYITAMNENYHMPEMPKGVEEGIIKGMYCLREPKGKGKHLVQLLGCGTILREVIAAADILAEEHDIDAAIWSVPSFTECARDGQANERERRFAPEGKHEPCYVEACLNTYQGPVIAATDYSRAYANQIREFVPHRYTVLGTDGYGRSDTREALRDFFEVDRRYIVVATLATLADEGVIDRKLVTKALKKYKIDTDKPCPTTV